MENNTDLDKTDVYPFCYKIKETCLPCPKKQECGQNEGVSLLAKFLAAINNNNEKNEYYNKLINFFDQYGDIYKNLKIELYVNPATKKILFPNNERIQASLNQYLFEIGTAERAPGFISTTKFVKLKNDCIAMYNILLNEKLRGMYNDVYISEHLAEASSIKPKTYGIARLIGESSGGKKSKKQIRRKMRTAKKNKKIKI